MVVISSYLINHPYQLTSLNTFAEKYESAKSSISEDIVIIKRVPLKKSKLVRLRQLPVLGGVVFTPSISEKEGQGYRSRPLAINCLKAIESCLAAVFTYQICLVRHLFSIISVASFT